MSMTMADFWTWAAVGVLVVIFRIAKRIGDAGTRAGATGAPGVAKRPRLQPASDVKAVRGPSYPEPREGSELGVRFLTTLPSVCEARPLD